MSKKQDANAAEDEKPKGGKMKKLMGITIGALTLIGAGVGGGFYYSSAIADSSPAQDPHRPKLVERVYGVLPEPTEEGKEEPLKEGTVYVKNDQAKVDPSKYEVTYYKLPQNFTANLGEGANFVQLGISLATYYDGKVVLNIKRQMVPIRSAVLLTLSEQEPEELASSEGKKDLQKKLTVAINDVLRAKEGFGGIDNVYFTNLVIQ